MFKLISIESLQKCTTRLVLLSLFLQLPNKKLYTKIASAKLADVNCQLSATDSC